MTDKDLRPVWLDPWLVVLAKPCGLLSQPGLGPDLADSVISRARRRWPGARLVHRLDRDTTGLILLALDGETHRRLGAAFAERRVRKTYLARVQGVPAARGGLINQPLARIGTSPPRYGVVTVAEGGRPALTRWRCLAASGDPAGRWRALVLQPRTGRSHQLRAHLAWLGHPLLGDPIYGPAPGERHGLAPCLQLRAVGLRFTHPQTGEVLRLRWAGPWADLSRLAD
ncbi:MAG: RluA family pseudouridine synthase [Synechococcaceae cyanobacterium]